MNFWRVALLITSLFLTALLTSSRLRAEPHQDARPGARHRRVQEKTSGILTDRIPERLLPKWKAVEELALAENSSGQPLHPTLRSLWEWIETSGHAVHIELIGQTKLSSSTAGNFSIEQFDPTGEKHEAVIRLYLSNIDQAFVGDSVARPNGFIPFQNLKREERYAEVLGHEMAHAIDILSDLEKARLVEEVVEQTNEILLSQHTTRKGKSLDIDLAQRLSSRDSLLLELEKRAEKTEAIIWQELINSLSARGRATDSSIARRN